ncbi:MAG TPA: prefoldin subunit beta [Candidatus Nanoarchaeia archaeon]|nr:prefoldin subunit beta [Candidatus Nanoarchaeia archaeon]
MSSENLNQLQLLQQNLQNILSQKQQFEAQLVELDSALTELKTTSQAYKIVGKIMIASSKEDLIKDLGEKKEVAGIRLKNLIKQEESLQQNIQSIQDKLMKEISKKK